MDSGAFCVLYMSQYLKNARPETHRGCPGLETHSHWRIAILFLL
nr:MAG TPA: hypothetical protein [Caudoviricetes sp.]